MCRKNEGGNKTQWVICIEQEQTRGDEELRADVGEGKQCGLGYDAGDGENEDGERAESGDRECHRDPLMDRATALAPGYRSSRCCL
jgi:hypothetical protein